jgi:hypothetical protein
MGQDEVISRMMADTFEDEGHVIPFFSGSPEGDFHLKRGLSRLPVNAFRGQWISRGLAQFNLHGTMLDLPIGHFPVSGWSEHGGVITCDEAFTAACSTLLGFPLTHVYVAQHEDQSPWLVFWNESDGEIGIERLQGLFFTSDDLKKAA